ncbi:hypothetical protein [Leptolyngbya sp. FACHB-711]|uniref:hypothetical protein n=1 Tax=Leptolyngbya sp. FACHB-711 TaxID=2692813 RepID=UPI001683A7EF|nr:hypothetical protein [Leptolyngbya sp. FACHB-711]MBD1848459.1 hypothetical protein [Cyanobacteria bacterium FACHB-502]MBD2028187.1 hypothetical protein [Leptolyngbya sp. FACHB-711]
MTGTNNQMYVKPIFEQPSLLFPNAASVQEAIHLHNQQLGLPNAQHNKGKNKEELKKIYINFE